MTDPPSGSVDSSAPPERALQPDDTQQLDSVQFLRLYARIASRLAVAAEGEADAVIEHALGLIGLHFGADRVALGRITRGGATSHPVLAWLRDGAPVSERGPLVTRVDPPVVERLRSAGVYHFQARDASDGRDPGGLTGALVVRVSAVCSSFATLSVQVFGEPPRWSAIDEDHLRRLGEVLAGSLGRIEAERALATAEARYRLVAEAMPGFLAHVDAGHAYHFVNRRYEQVFGRSPAEIIGRRVPELLGEDAYRRIAPLLDDALAGRPREQVTHIDTPDGRRELQASP